jgi:predicted alpha/beta hydrolase family esterase
LVSGGMWTTPDGFETPENLQNLFELEDKVYIIHSDNDNIVDPKLSYALHRTLPKANLVITHNQGHLNSESDELLSLIMNYIKKPKVWIALGRSITIEGSFYKTLNGFLNQNNLETEYIIVPNSYNATAKEWQESLYQIKHKISPQDIFVTHSSSCINLARFLSDNEIKIQEWHLVGGVFDENLREDQDELITNITLGFDPKSINYESIQTKVQKIYIHHSKDDKRVNFESALNYKMKLSKAFLCQYENYGHFVKYDENGKADILTPIYFDELCAILKKNHLPTDFEIFYPTQEMLTAKEIFYQWIVRMSTLSYYFTAQIPYSDLIITPTVLDEKGKKMSKSLGNGLDPVAQIDKYSSDSLRMAMLSGMIPNRNMKMGGRLADELCEKYRNFGNKMWNIARFFEYQETRFNKSENKI